MCRAFGVHYYFFGPPCIGHTVSAVVLLVAFCVSGYRDKMTMSHHLLIVATSLLCFVISASSRGDDVLTSSSDIELIKLYLEEFRLELMSVKSQLVRMARNSKLVRTSLKELRSAKCGHNTDSLGMRLLS